MRRVAAPRNVAGWMGVGGGERCGDIELQSKSVSCLGFGLGFVFGVAFGVGCLVLSFLTGGGTVLVVGCVCAGLPRGPFGGGVDSGLSVLPLAFPPSGNGGIGGNKFLFGDGPLLAFAFGLGVVFVGFSGGCCSFRRLFVSVFICLLVCSACLALSSSASILLLSCVSLFVAPCA